VSALQVLAVLRGGAVSLAKAAEGVRLYPQVLVNVAMRERFDFSADPVVMRAVAKAEAALSGKGRVLLRASGTEPLVRVMVEGRVQRTVERWAQVIADAVRMRAELR
jgi:phosphoglucosamine mutase